MPDYVYPDAGEGATAPARTRDTSWAARYGRLILQDGIAGIPTALYYYQGALALTAQEVWFTSYVLAHKWDADLPYPSLNAMARCSGVDLSWLKRIRRSLSLKGWLVVAARLDASGRQEANSYDFGGLFTALEAAIAAAPPPPNAIQAEAGDSDPIPAEGRDGSFVARYGRLIAQVGIAAVPRALFTYQAALQLTPQQVWFVGYILAHRWTTDLPHPSLVRMAERTGYGVRHLHNIKDALVEQGYLTLVHRYSASGGKDSNGYDFSGLLTAISAQLRADKPAGGPVAVLPAPLAPPRRRGIVRVAEASADGGPLVHMGGGPGLPMGQTAAYAGGEQHRQLADGERGVPMDGGPSVPMAGEPVVQVVGGRSVRMGGAPSVPKGVGPQVQQGGGPPVQEGGGPRLHWPGAPAVQPREGRAAQRSGVKAAQGSGAPAAHKKDAEHEDANHEEHDSNRSPIAGKQEHERPVTYSPYIAGVVLDYSREFGDGAHGPANITQALRLWQA
ncbi:MAG TPA: hypothetical protein VM536_16610, partial [Chloroflexia bacterium]|nr:hypothetical protein [Chloroflexia bacterium]